MKLSVILTGATGMVGEGVLIECLSHPEVEKVLIINRRQSGFEHPKLREIIHSDFNDITSLQEQLSGYNACFFCSGVSSVGKKEAEYTSLTYGLTMNFARRLSDINADMVFCYISGTGTDSSEQGRIMWARVKGKTENDLMKLPFRKVYNFRPGALKKTEGQKNMLTYYKYFAWLIPVFRLIAPGSVSTMRELGLGMINAALYGFDKNVIEVNDFKQLAKR